MELRHAYSDYDGDSDPTKEPAMVKQNLVQAIPSVVPMRIGPLTNPSLPMGRGFVGLTRVLSWVGSGSLGRAHS